LIELIELIELIDLNLNLIDCMFVCFVWCVTQHCEQVLELKRERLIALNPRMYANAFPAQDEEILSDSDEEEHLLRLHKLSATKTVKTKTKKIFFCFFILFLLVLCRSLRLGKWILRC
jgi:hypothetical protein